MVIPVAVRSKVWVYCRSPVWIASSKPAEGMDVCLLRVLCVVGYKSLQRADHSSRGVAHSVVCLSMRGCFRHLPQCPHRMAFHQRHFGVRDLQRLSILFRTDGCCNDVPMLLRFQELKSQPPYILQQRSRTLYFFASKGEGEESSSL